MARPDAPTGRIIAAHGRHYIVEMPDGALRTCFPRGKRTGPAVGDTVRISPQGADEGAIDEVIERRNLLYRSDDMRTKQFAANVDQLLVVIAPEPAYSDDLLGRALVAARHAGIAPVIVLNKVDLARGSDAVRERLKLYGGWNLPVVETCALDPAATREKLMPLLQNRCSLLLGQSGMGKSTLLNALVPDADAATREHSHALGTGKHTTTSTRLYHLPGGLGDIIDSPGFQGFGLAHLSHHDLEEGFPEFSDGREHCRFYNCTHRHEPGCGVLAALQAGHIPAERHALYLRLLDEHAAKPKY